MMKLSECDPFVRTAEIQPAILEGEGLRAAYDYRLFYVLEHDGAVITEAGATEISAGSLIIFPPATGYCFRGRLRVAVLNFDMTRACRDRSRPICPPPLSDFDQSLMFDTTVADGFEKPLMLHGDVTLRESVLDIVREFGVDGQSDAVTSARLKLLLAELLRSLAPRGDERLLCRRVMGYIRAKSVEIRDNAELGEAFGYHPAYLNALFKKETGLTLHQAIKAERVRLACRLLSQTDRSVEEIADMTGFCSRSHFCTVFKEKMGISPAKYRTYQRKSPLTLDTN